MRCSSTRKLSQLPSCSFSAPGALVCPDNAVRGRDVFIDNDLSAATHTRSANCVTLFRRTPPALSPSSIRHRRLLPFPGGVACTLKTRLRQLCSGRASSILTEAPSVCSQGCGSSGVSPKSLRSVDFKVAVMAFRVLHGLAPPYLNDLVHVADLPGRRRLRSSSSHQLLLPPFLLTAVDRRTFPVAASLPSGTHCHLT